MREIWYRYIYFLLFCFTAATTFAQVPQYYMNHTDYEFAVNPAITGRDYYPVVNFSHKKYLSGISGAPTSTSLGGTMRMGTYDFYTPKMMLNRSGITSVSRMGLGGFVMHEKDGPLQYIHATFNYAYFIPINNASSQLSFGLSYQLMHYSIDKSDFRVVDITKYDEKLESLNDQPLVSEASFGLYFHNDQFYLGASASDLLKSDISLTSISGKKNKYDLFINSGYKFFLTLFEIEPSIFLASIDNSFFYYYVSTKLYFLQYNWLSIAYRSTNTMRYGLGIKINRYHLAYFYEHNVGPVFNYNSGTHEIMLGLNIGLFEAEGLRKASQ